MVSTCVMGTDSTGSAAVKCRVDTHNYRIALVCSVKSLRLKDSAIYQRAMTGLINSDCAWRRDWAFASLATIDVTRNGVRLTYAKRN